MAGGCNGTHQQRTRITYARGTGVADQRHPTAPLQQSNDFVGATALVVRVD